MERITESPQETKNKRRDSRFKEMREYIPYSVAKRLKEVITFSVKLAGRCPDLNIDSNTRKALECIDAENHKR